MIKQAEHIIIAKELGTFHVVEKMYYKHIALYLIESDVYKNRCLIVDENLTVIQRNVRTFADFELDDDSPVSKNFDESAFDKLEAECKQLNVQCKNNAISYDALTVQVNLLITDIVRKIYTLLATNAINDMQAYFLNAIIQYIVNEAFENIESPYVEQNAESDDENY